MAIRTDTGAVEELLGDYYNGTTDLNQYLDVATMWTDDVEAADTAGGMDASRLEMIERYLAAHAYAMTVQVPEYVQVDVIQERYQGQTKTKFSGTKWGQMAVMLDKTGTLQAIDDGLIRSTPSITWEGKDPDDEVDYYDRDVS